MSRSLVLLLPLLLLPLHFPPGAQAHEIGEGSDVVVETKISINAGKAKAWPGGEGLASCVQAALVSQGRHGAYTVVAYLSSDGGPLNNAAFTLTGDDGLTMRHQQMMTGDGVGQAHATLNAVASPSHPFFTDLCENLTGTQITFTPTGKAQP